MSKGLMSIPPLGTGQGQLFGAAVHNRELKKGEFALDSELGYFLCDVPGMLESPTCTSKLLQHLKKDACWVAG